MSARLLIDVGAGGGIMVMVGRVGGGRMWLGI